MKKLAYIIFAAVTLLAVNSCRKLDVPVQSQYTTSNFPVTTADFTALLGTMYSNLAANWGITYWRMQELSTDEAILPARDGNFDDGGQYRLMHYHTWTVDHPYVMSNWAWGFGTGITNCNRILNLIAQSPASAAQKASNVAETRAMRALYYFFMMDSYGNVPIYTDFPVTTPPATQPRAAVFAFIESELKAVIPLLPKKPSDAATQTLQYGRANREMAFAILQKMYLNAQVYNNTNRLQDAVAMGDSILRNTNYSLDASYRTIFLPNNGPQIQETIFAVPYDQQIPGNQFTRFGFFPPLLPYYTGLNFVSGSIAMSTTPEFYARFNLPGDFRTNTWLVGPQYIPDGNGGFTNQPATYLGQQIVITAPLILTGLKPMDVGNTAADQAEGVRSIKFYPDPTYTQTARLNGNDMPMFRLADVMLMKAEAILRGATATTVNGVLQTPDYLVNAVRKRSGAPTQTGITLNQMLDERARELSWEGWRRNDLIRFGQFEVQYPLPNDNLTMNTDPTRRLYPVPSNEILLNPNLVQNPGY
jgi:hypothetical protein